MKMSAKSKQKKKGMTSNQAGLLPEYEYVHE